MNKKFLSVVLFGALLASSTGTFTSCKDYDDDINGLQEQIDANKKTLDEKSAALQTALEKANADITAAKAAAAAAQTAADKAQATGDAAKLAASKAELAAAAALEAAAQAKKDAIAEAVKLVDALKAVVEKKVDQSVYDARVKVIDAHLNVIDGKLSDLATADIAIKVQIDALEKFQKAIEALKLTTAFPELQGQVATLITDLGALKGRVANNETDIKTLKEDLQKVSTRIGNLEVRLGTIEEDVKKIGDKLNTLSSLLSHRLTSLTFVPSTFINGIEVINFATLEYKAWDESKLLADKTDGTQSSTINDGKTQAIYYANPTSVKKEDITTLSVLTQDATNITRATAAPIITASLMSVGNDGKMVINLKKNSDAPFTDSKEDNVEKFTLIALKADIKTTEEELKNGLQPTVVSDWARLAETKVTPRIHYTKYEFGKAFTENLETGVIPHFYPYTKIHNAATGGVCDTEGKYIIKELEYTAAPFDLSDLVGVCSGTNNVMHNAADHGLAFEFKLVNYNLKDNGEEKTNQLSFAKITDKKMISSQARNGIPNNKDAIGREPLVQVVLRNTANSEVVDVRYFKIKWTPKQEVKNLGNLGIYTDVFDKESCNKSYAKTVGTATMNDKVYAELNVSKEVFHQLNVLDTKVYATYETAKEGTPAVANLGSIKEINAEGSTTTINLKWTFPIDQNTITPAEYELGQAVRTVYGRYTDNVEHAGIYIFELKLTLNITKMAFNAGYVQTYWNEGSILTSTNRDKVFQVNPALTSDETYGINQFFDCQIIADMLKGYNKTGVTITRPLDLVANASAAVLVFDAARLKDILGIGWTCTDGVTLKKDNVTAATIAGSIIRLYEKPPTINTHGTPTAAAQELLGKNVPVKLVASYCNGTQELTAELDHFLVNFIKPLEMTLADVADSFKDLLTNGSTISVSNVATVKETFGDKRNVWVNGYPALNSLGQWYDVKNVTWNIAKAKTNLKKVGNDIIITANPEESDWSDFDDKYKLTASPGEINANILTFVNNSGAHLQQAFQIAIPVYASVKWAPISQLYAAKKYVVLTVNPGTVK